MIEITPSIHIDEREVQFEFVRASGPGGQNVNKVATAVQLRFDVRASSLPAEVKARLVKLGGSRVTEDGILVIEARRHRTQDANRADALARLAELVRKAAVRPKTRRRTRPTQAAKEERLKAKKQRAVIKKSRQGRLPD
ncbi:MAG: alternative ribosome rescue aminoacyl-tRNA hydrolase ArfB [Chloroflexota bacterium]